jgi:2-phospho-L-lactate guanylyltransferase (CobY/MobA/RfbA family)
MPADIPLVQSDDIAHLLALHGQAIERGTPLFAIVPARDERGSNAVICSPATVVPLRFGEDSFVAHLAAARASGIEPTIARLPRIALDIDRPNDLASLLATDAPTRTHALLRRWRQDGLASLSAADARST